MTPLLSQRPPLLPQVQEGKHDHIGSLHKITPWVSISRVLTGQNTHPFQCSLGAPPTLLTSVHWNPLFCSPIPRDAPCAAGSTCWNSILGLTPLLLSVKGPHLRTHFLGRDRGAPPQLCTLPDCILPLRAHQIVMDYLHFRLWHSTVHVSRARIMSYPLSYA